MMGRALAPIETAIANWRGFVSARQSITRLSAALARVKPSRAVTVLPKPSRSLDVVQVTATAPGAGRPIVAGANFSLKSGEVLGIIGPSGAGKTSLVRTLVGIWPPAAGHVHRHDRLCSIKSKSFFFADFRNQHRWPNSS